MIIAHVVAFAQFDDEMLQHPESPDKPKQNELRQRGQVQIKIA